MKKIISVCLALVLALGLTGVCLAESENARPAPSPDPYSGIWQRGRVSAEIVWEEEGYRVLIHWGSSAWEATEWEYSCDYREDDHAMVSMPSGVRTELVFDDQGEQTSFTVVYEDGEAVFSLDGDGCLIWQDKKDNAGEGMRFVRTGDYPAVPDEAIAG